MSDATTETTETLRMCVTCGRMHSLRAQRCGSCRQSFADNGTRTRRIARVGDGEGAGDAPLFEVSRRPPPLPRSPGPAVSRRLIPRRGMVRQARVSVATQG